MALIDTSLLTLLETALGDAYQKLVTAQGDVNTPGTVVYNVNRAKLALRGGIDAGYGLAPGEYIDNYTMGVASIADSISWMVYVPTTSAYIGGQLYKNGSTLINLETLSEEDNRAYTGYVTRGYTGNILHLSKLYYGGVYGPDSTNPPIPAPSWEPPVSIPTYEVPIAKIVVAGNPDDGPFVAVAQMCESDYFPPPTDADEVITDNFSALNTLEDAELVRNRSNVLTNAVNALKTHTISEAGTEFKTYWKTQGYQFTDGFGRLYSDINGADLSTDLMKLPSLTLSPTTMDKLLYRAGSLEAVLTSTQGAATVSLSVFGVATSSAKVYSLTLPDNHTVRTESNTWMSATGGYVAFRNVVSDAPYWRVASYSSVASTAEYIDATLGFITDEWTGNFIPYTTDVYKVDKVTAYVVPGAALNSVVDVGTTNYRGVAHIAATGGTYPLANTTAFTIRNK